MKIEIHAVKSMGSIQNVLYIGTKRSMEILALVRPVRIIQSYNNRMGNPSSRYDFH